MPRSSYKGITGRQGSFHATKMLEYGTSIVGGCTPGKGGSTVELGGHSVHVWDSMEAAIETTMADASVIYVPPPFAAMAIMEAEMPSIGFVERGSSSASRKGFPR